MVERITHPRFDGIIGVARRDITPEPGTYSRLWGASAHTIPTGVHRPLYASVLMLRADKNSDPIFIISLDLCSWRSLSDEWLVRGPVLSALGVPKENVLISLTHTHAAPVTMTYFSNRPGGEKITPYIKFVARCTIEACKEAIQRAQPAQLEWEKGVCGLAVDRRYAPPGGEGVVCGFNPHQKVDNTLLVGRVTNQDSILVGVLLNYACHPTSLGSKNTLTSPDYIGAAREVVEKEVGGICQFLLGATGDLTPRRSYSSDPNIADANGEVVGFAALSVLKNMLPPGRDYLFAGVERSGADLALWEASKLQAEQRGLQACSPKTALKIGSIPTVEEIRQRLKENKDEVMQERLERTLCRREDLGGGEHYDFPGFIILAGEVVFIGAPTEFLSEFQVLMRERFRDLSVVVMNITNGHIGYMPSRKDFEQEAYEVGSCFFSAGSLESLIETFSSAIEALRKSILPTMLRKGKSE